MDDRIALFEISEFPGNESRIDCAFFLGSSAGTLDADRELVSVVVRAGRVREERAGRRRAAARALVSYCLSANWGRMIPRKPSPYQKRFLPSGMPL